MGYVYAARPVRQWEQLQMRQDGLFLLVREVTEYSSYTLYSPSGGLGQNFHCTSLNENITRRCNWLQIRRGKSSTENNEKTVRFWYVKYVQEKTTVSL